MIILAEKPNVAKDFAKALDAEQKDGFYKNSDIIITYCVGHLFELVEPDYYDEKFKKWNIDNLPIIPSNFYYQKNGTVAEQTNKVLSILKAHSSEKIIIATDADREGELIARIVLRQAGITDITNCYRFWVSEALTPEVIKKGLEKIRPLSEYNTLALQAYARQHADWLIGMNFTRFISSGNSSIFSVGRVQTALLACIAKRNYEVKNFISEPYNELEAEITDCNGIKIKALLINPSDNKTAFDLKDEHLKNALSCNNRKIQNVVKKEAVKTIKPPKLLDSTELQKESYILYGYSPEKTLIITQSLYEKYKCLSYPRTSSRVMGDDNVELFRNKFNLLKPLYPTISGFCKTDLITENNKHIFNSKELESESHHAFIPLKAIPKECSDEERNVFNIVVDNFFTVCMEDYKYNEKHLTFSIDIYQFQATIKDVIQKGFKNHDCRKVTTIEEAQEVTGFNEKDCKVTKVTVLNKKTMPKKNYTLDTLLTFMKNPKGDTSEKLVGLGTAATRADIIKKLFTNRYVENKNKCLVATDKGIFLLKELSKDADLAKIANVSQTTKWEQQLKENPLEFEKQIKLFIVNCIKPELKSIYKAPSPGNCPLCGNEMKEGKLNYYCSAYKGERNCKYVIWKNTFGASISFSDCQKLLSKSKTAIKNCKSKDGKKFKATMRLDDEGKIKLSFQ